MSAARASGLHSSSSLTRREPFLGGSLSAVLPRDGRRERLWNPLAAADRRTPPATDSTVAPIVTETVPNVRDAR